MVKTPSIIKMFPNNLKSNSVHKSQLINKDYTDYFTAQNYKVDTESNFHGGLMRNGTLSMMKMHFTAFETSLAKYVDTHPDMLWRRDQ